MNNHGKLIAQGKLVQFKATDGMILHGFLSEYGKSDTCVIYVHGMGSSFYSGRLVSPFANACHDAGYSFLSINTRGHDMEAYEKFDGNKRKGRWIGTRYEKFEESRKDIEGAVKLAKAYGYKKIFLVGHSTGCQKILYYQYSMKRKIINALVFLAPDDDYNLNRVKFGRKWMDMVRLAKTLAHAGKGNDYERKLPFSPNRFLSVADMKNVEARLFNYDGKMREFSSIGIPIMVVFGTLDEGAVKPVSEYVEILKEKTAAKTFCSAIIEGATHSFKKNENAVASLAVKWLRSV